MVHCIWWCGTPGFLNPAWQAPAAATLVGQAVGLSARPDYGKEPFAQTNPSDGLDGSSTPAAGLTAWGQTKQGGRQGHVSGARTERRGTRTWQGSKQGLSSQGIEQLDLLCCTWNCLLKKSVLVTKPSKWWRSCTLAHSRIFALGEKKTTTGFPQKKQRVGDRKNNKNQLDFQWILDF